MARLEPVGGGPRIELRSGRAPIAVGSAPDNGLVLSDRMISRRHATLEFRDDAWILADARSTNGTYLNNQRINAATVLRDGDEVRFGAVAYVFRGDARSRSYSSQLRRSWAIPLLLVGAGIATYLFVTNFSALEIASLNQSVDGGETGAGAASAPRAAPTVIAARTMRAAATPALAVEHGTKPWLDSLNAYRASVGLAALPDNPHYSPGCKLHSEYLVNNYADRISSHQEMGSLMHTEDPAKPGYTKAGLRAGQAGDVDEMWDPGGIAKLSWAIDDWMSAPFHRLPILDFHLHSVGYGAACAKGVCVATLNVHGDVDLMLSEPHPLSKAIAYPPAGGTISATSFEGEWPDPLASCPGYSLPAGYPISLQLGPLVTPAVGAYAVTIAGAAPERIEACEFDANNFKSADPEGQRLAREILRNYGATVIIPRAPLKAGKYAVSISADKAYAWSFSVNP